MSDDPLHEHFRLLPLDRQREVVRRLHAIRGYDAVSIASMSGLSVAAVEQLLAQADESEARNVP